MFSELIALLFFSRDYAHRAHLRADSHAVHTALDLFYKELPELIDQLVEVYQGMYGLLDIPYLDPALAAGPDPIQAALQPIQVLEQHAQIIEGLQIKVLGSAPTLENIVDEILALYRSTIYKLRFLA